MTAFYRPLPASEYTRIGEYRGFQCSPVIDEDEARRLRRSAASVRFVESVVMMNQLNPQRHGPKSGILQALAKRFFPTTGAQTPSWNTSSAEIGTTVDAQLREFAQSRTLTDRSHRYTRLAAEFCRRHGYFPLAAQLDLVVGTRLTAIDLLCLNNYTGRVVVLEVKTGYDNHYDRPCPLQPTMHFFPDVPNTQKNQHLLQLSIMVHALTKPPYQMPREGLESCLLRINDTHGVCVPVAVPQWYDDKLVMEVIELPLSKVRTRLRKDERLKAKAKAKVKAKAEKKPATKRKK